MFLHKRCCINFHCNYTLKQVLSRDSVTVSVEAVVYYRVSNPTMAVSHHYLHHMFMDIQSRGKVEKNFSFDEAKVKMAYLYCVGVHIHPSPRRGKINNSFQVTLSILFSFSGLIYAFYSKRPIKF